MRDRSVGQQLTLSIQLRDEATFANFVAGDNAALLSQLSQLLTLPDERFFYLWGNAGAGKTHLLQACCHLATQHNLGSVYLSLADPVLSPDVLQGLEQLAVLGIDDIDVIANNAAWQEALFHLYNRVREGNAYLIIGANNSPPNLAITLADLRSRLAWGQVYQVKPLDDEKKIHALQLRAEQRGFKLSVEVASFLLNRCSRDMSNLYQILETLDAASLSEQRSLTIPFVKKTLAI